MGMGWLGEGQGGSRQAVAAAGQSSQRLPARHSTICRPGKHSQQQGAAVARCASRPCIAPAARPRSHAPTHLRLWVGRVAQQADILFALGEVQHVLQILLHRRNLLPQLLCRCGAACRPVCRCARGAAARRRLLRGCQLRLQAVQPPLQLDTLEEAHLGGARAGAVVQGRLCRGCRVPAALAPGKGEQPQSAVCCSDALSAPLPGPLRRRAAQTPSPAGCSKEPQLPQCTGSHLVVSQRIFALQLLAGVLRRRGLQLLQLGLQPPPHLGVQVLRRRRVQGAGAGWGSERRRAAAPGGGGGGASGGRTTAGAAGAAAARRELRLSPKHAYAASRAARAQGSRRPTLASRRCRSRILPLADLCLPVCLVGLPRCLGPPPGLRRPGPPCCCFPMCFPGRRRRGLVSGGRWFRGNACMHVGGRRQRAAAAACHG